MGNLWNKEALFRLLENLKKDYDVFAPRLYAGTGCYSDTDIVRYGIIESFDQIVWDKKSDYSFKEALLPISDTIMYFTETTTRRPLQNGSRKLFSLSFHCFFPAHTGYLVKVRLIFDMLPQLCTDFFTYSLLAYLSFYLV